MVDDVKVCLGGVGGGPPDGGGGGPLEGIGFGGIGWEFDV